MPQTISAKRIESDVHLKVTLQDSGVSIAWDSVDIKQVCMYSVEQHAFAGHCSFTVSGEDNKILLVTYPASEQLYTGDYRIVARLVLDGDEHTYDALAFTLKPLSDESGSITTEDIEVGIQVEEVDTTIMYEILTACQAATDSALAAEAAIEEAEAARVAAENLRVQAENAREAAEAARVQAEQLRVSAEASREAAEAARVQAEQARVSAEQLRATAETARVEAESARVTAENAREAAEAARVQAESARVAAEQGRVTAETARVQAENAREAAEAARVQAESARVAAEAARVQAESAREAAEAARVQQASSDHTRAEADHTATEAAAAQAIAAAQAADAAREAIADELDKKANKDGSYSQMQVGASENLIGQNPLSSFFTFRRTGNGKAGTGAAQIKMIRGVSLLWNQLVKNGNFASGDNWEGDSSTTRTVSDNVMEVVRLDNYSTMLRQNLGRKAIVGHKYYVNIEFNFSTGDSLGRTLRFYLFGDSSGNNSMSQDGSSYTSYTGVGAWAKSSNVFEAYHSYSGSTYIYITIPPVPGGDLTNNSFKFRKIQVVDLTEMFGAGKEPTASQFTNLYRKFPYIFNSGKITPFKGSGLKASAFNQWNEQWVRGTINSDGTDASSGTKIRSSYIPVIPGSTYFYRINQSGGSNASDAAFYDGNKNFISYTTGLHLNSEFTVPAGAHYMRFSPSSQYGNTYLDNICINFSNPNKNGEYEPYVENTLDIDVSGKSATDSNGNTFVPFPDGIHGVKTDYDWFNRIGGEKVFGVKVFSASDEWEIVDTYARTTLPPNAHFSTLSALTSNGLTPLQSGVPNTQGSMSFGSNGYFNVNIDGVGSHVASAMNGVVLVYELSAPIPFTWDEPLSLNYAENCYGTELLLPDGLDSDGVPQTAPITADILYPIDAINTIIGLPKDYISAESFKNYLDARVAAGEIAGYTMTFNATTNKYDFTITPQS